MGALRDKHRVKAEKTGQASKLQPLSIGALKQIVDSIYRKTLAYLEPRLDPDKFQRQF